MMDGQRGADTRLVTALIWLIGLCIFVNYVDRGTLGIAAPRLKADLGLTATQYGVAASAFFWVYAPGQFVMGWLVDRARAQWLLAIGLALWALATGLTAFANSLPMLVALRVLLGLGEATAFVSAFKLIIDHVPEKRRGTAIGAITVGLALGPAVGTLGGGLLLAALSWRWLFGLLGVATLVWLVPWLRVAARLPTPDRGDAPQDTPSYWRILANRPALSLALLSTCSSFGIYFAVTWLPLWLVDVRGYAITDMAWLGSLVFAMQALAGFTVGRLSDRLTVRGLPSDKVRRFSGVAGFLLVFCGFSVLGLAQGTPAVVTGLVLAGTGIGTANVSLNLIAQLYVGAAVMGKWTGMLNGIGNLAGVANPLITGAIVDVTGSYNWAFALAAIVPLFGAVALVVLLPPIRPINWGPAVR